MIKKLLSAGLLLAALNAGAQTIPNAGFESWSNQGFGDEPDGWITLNALSIIGVPTTVTESATAHSGTSSARCETVEADLDQNDTMDVIPATLAIGNFMSQSSGMAISTRPDSLVGWFIYDPQGNDEFAVSGTLSKWNSSTSLSENVGNISFTMGATPGSGFVRVSIPVDYFSTETPDSLQLSILSSADEPVTGSVLWVDDLSFITNPGTVGVAEQVAPVLQLYPNPAKDVLTIVSPDNAELVVYNALGMRVESVKTTAGKATTLNTSAYENGVYLLKSAQGIQRFVVKH